MKMCHYNPLIRQKETQCDKTAGYTLSKRRKNRSITIAKYYTKISTFTGATIMSLVLMANNAAARLDDGITVMTITTVKAIHRPTGCIARLEISGGVLLSAMIIDPLCLPVNVRAQAVPAFWQDFHLPASYRHLFRGP